MEKEYQENSQETFNYYFHWNIEAIIEVSQIICDAKNNSEIWTTDGTAERNIVKNFIKQKKFEEIYKDLIIQDLGENLIVNKNVLEDCFDFINNYRDDYY